MAVGSSLVASNTPAMTSLVLSDGAVETVQTTVPDWLAVGFSLATNLGDPWIAVPVLAVMYWFGVRERALPLFGAVLGGMSLVLLAKALLGFPRPTVGPPVPPETLPDLLRPLYLYTVAQEGYGVPSGHAATATLVWGAVALSLPGTLSARRVFGAATVIAVVAFSRIALGVHYPIDIIAGVAIGVVVLAVALAINERVENAETILFAGGTVVAVAGVFVYGPAIETLSLLGGLLGGLAGIRLFSLSATPFGRSPRWFAIGGAGLAAVLVVSGGTAVLVLGAVSLLWGLDSAVEGGALILTALAPTVVLGLAILGWPVLVERAELA